MKKFLLLSLSLIFMFSFFVITPVFAIENLESSVINEEQEQPSTQPDDQTYENDPPKEPTPNPPPTTEPKPDPEPNPQQPAPKEDGKETPKPQHVSLSISHTLNENNLTIHGKLNRTID